jgi:hypothetical protein
MHGNVLLTVEWVGVKEETVIWVLERGGRVDDEGGRRGESKVVASQTRR